MKESLDLLCPASALPPFRYVETPSTIETPVIEIPSIIATLAIESPSICSLKI